MGSLAAVVVLAGLPILMAAPATAAEDYTFVQSQRMNSLTLQGGTDAFATQNRLGGALGGIALTQAQTSLNSSVANGSTSIIFEMPDLADLSGANDPSFTIGVMKGVAMQPPGNPATYDGANDLDWWYQPDPSDVDAGGEALRELSASLSGTNLTAGPGTITFANPFGPAPLTMSNTRVQATTGSVSPPLDSTNGFPPGHLPEENIPDSLTSFGAMTSGRIAGNVSAASLATTPIAPGLAGSGLSNCSQGYTPSNSMLDVLVGGCTIFLIPAIVPSQPDTSDPAHGTGTYVFTTNLVTKAVTGCLHNGVPGVLADCLAAAAYSSYFQFTTDRVIVRRECEPGSYSSIGFSPCTLAEPGFFVEDAGATSQAPCPAGTTSLGAGAASCPAFVTAAEVLCTNNPVPIGVATLCTMTVGNEISAPAPTGAVSWSRPTGAGTYTPPACLLIASGETGGCSTSFVPAPASAGSKQLSASYIGDATHKSSSDGYDLQVVKRSTATSVRCKPKRVRHGKSTVCRARITDVTTGTKVAPKGKVRWAAAKRFGAFKAATCRLATINGVTSCKMAFKTKRKIRGRIGLSAAYLGDSSHKGSSRRFRVRVI